MENKKENINYFDLAIEIAFLVFIFLVSIIFDRRIGIVFSLTKTTIMRVILAIILGVWATKIILVKKTEIADSPFNWPVLTYLLSVTVATITSIYVLVSFWGFYGRYEGLLTLYNYGLCLFIVINYIRSSVQIKRLIATIMSAAALMSIYGIIQRAGTDPYAWGGVPTKDRVIGTIGQPNFFAAYIIMAFMLLLVFYFADKKLLAGKPQDVPKKHLGNRAAKDKETQTAIFWWLEQLLIVGYFAAVQAIFLLMIYRLDLPDIFLWYLGFFVITVFALLFSFNFQKLHPLILDGLVLISFGLIYLALLFTQSRGGFTGFVFGGTLFLLLAGRKILLGNARKIVWLGIVIAVITAAGSFTPIERFATEVKFKTPGAQEQGQKQTTREKAAEVNLELGVAAGSRAETWTSAFGIIADRPLFGIGPEVLKMVFPRYETDLFRYKEAFHVKQDRCHNSIFDQSVTRGMVSFGFYVWLLFTVFYFGIRNISKVSEEQRLMIAAALGSASAYFVQNQFSFGVVAIGSLFWISMGLVYSAVAPQKEEKTGFNFSIENIPWIPVSIVLALVIFLSYFAFVPFMGDLYYKKGKTYNDIGRFSEAIDNYKSSIDWFPYEGIVYTQQGIAAMSQAQSSGGDMRTLEQAEIVLRQGMRIDPYNADNFFILSKIYLIKSQFSGSSSLATAESLAKIALAIDPYYAEANEVLGNIYDRLGNPEKALAEYKIAAGINPALGFSVGRIIQISSQLGQIDKALEYFRQKARQYPWEINFVGPQGDILVQQGKVKEAILAFEKVLERDPKSIRAKVQIAKLLVSQGSFEPASSLLQEVVMADPRNVDAHTGLGAIYLRMGKPAQARAEFEQVLLVDPNNEYAKKGLGK